MGGTESQLMLRVPHRRRIFGGNLATIDRTSSLEVVAVVVKKKNKKKERGSIFLGFQRKGAGKAPTSKPESLPPIGGFELGPADQLGIPALRPNH